MAFFLLLLISLPTPNILMTTSTNHINSEPEVINYHEFTRNSMKKNDSNNKTNSEFASVEVQEIFPQSTAQEDQTSVNNLGRWQIVDDLRLGAVISANQKFGYVVHKPQFKKFRYEERSNDGLIHGEFGIVANGGRIRGVRYTADSTINPAVLYQTLMKFMSL